MRWILLRLLLLAAVAAHVMGESERMDKQTDE